MTFYCGECRSQTSPSAFVGCGSDALLLRWWMDGCQAEVKAVRALLSITHLSLSLSSQIATFSSMQQCLLKSQTTYTMFGGADH